LDVSCRGEKCISDPCARDFALDTNSEVQAGEGDWPALSVAVGVYLLVVYDVDDATRGAVGWAFVVAVNKG
jgi:hypothetical protein